MVVERISFPGGLPIVEGEEPKDTVASAMSKRRGKLTSLPAGDYDLTPPGWTHNQYKYNLTVDPDGTGDCHAVPLNPSAMMQDLDGNNPIVGERHFPIAKGYPSVIIAGANEDGVPSIYECLIYNPGKSPVR